MAGEGFGRGRKQTLVLTEGDAADDADEKKPRERDPVEELLASLNGAGVVKLNRVERGETLYVCTLPIDKMSSANIEQQVAEIAGGGTYYLKIHDAKGKYAGQCKVSIDTRAFKPRSLDEINGTAPAAPVAAPPPQLDMHSIASVVAQAVAATMGPLVGVVKELAERKPTQSGPDFLTLMTIMNQQHDRSVQLVAAAQGKHIEGPKSDWLSEIKRVREAAELLGMSGGGGQDTTAAERILSLVAPRAVELLGNKLLSDAAAPAPAPSPTLPVQRSAAAPQIAAAAPPAKVVPFGPAVRHVTGSGKLTPEQLERFKNRAAASRAPAPPSTGAPSASTVAPTAVEEKK